MAAKISVLRPTLSYPPISEVSKGAVSLRHMAICFGAKKVYGLFVFTVISMAKNQLN